MIIISILIGAASHVLWDSFTHDNGYFVQTIPILQNSVEFMGRQIPILKILQHASTLIGATAIAFAIYKIPVNNAEKHNVSFKYWGILSGLTLMIFTIRLLTGLEPAQYGNVIVTLISALLLSLVVTPLIMKIIKPAPG